MPWIILLFILGVPLFELYLLIEVGSQIGGFSTIVLCLLTAMAGLSIVRHQGMKIFTDMQKATAAGTPVGGAMIHGFFLALAGFFLFFPGFLTDTIGALLLVPPLRLALGKLGLAQMAVKRSSYRSHKSGTIIIEGEFVETPNKAQTDDINKAGKVIDLDPATGDILPKTNDKNTNNGEKPR